MGALFQDVKREPISRRQQEPIDGILFSEILYADDTLISGANTRCINVLLHAIENTRRMGSNSTTTNALTSCVISEFHQFASPQLACRRQTIVPRKHSAVYVGSLLTDSFDNKAEVLNRLGDCIATANRLKLFWQKARTSVKWKIQVFHAIIRSKLLYGLDSDAFSLPKPKFQD